ncbi:lipase family protein [Nitrosovibrio tenuis]|uniref:Lipase (Class 3) n=1 Tax=Nitrosovibrio tenuis TaxID=1233 RepID=A0A1H7N738_9PROT|nr:lipase family protein [Nitrosovibrio tenuis]SEL19416.1 Lipase (class 3) [Nitrosovibrio tenuis]
MSAVTTWEDLLQPGKATDFFARNKFPPFNPEAKSVYSRGNALWLAELSRLVYRHDIEEEDPPRQPTRTSFLENVGFKQRRFFISQNTQAMLVESAAEPLFAVLVFRGTEQNINSLITDFEFGILPLDQNTVGVHQGFRKALDSVWNSMEKELATLACPVFYTGHSLGAALATLAALRRAPQAVYTFASPRVGNEAFAASLGSLPIFRIVDDEDALTSLPPEVLGYRHVGALQLLKGPETGSALGWTGFSAPPKPLADHAPVNYVDRI